MRDGNQVQIDPVSRTYTVASGPYAQVGVQFTCTFTPGDLVERATVDRHISVLLDTITNARAHGLTAVQVGSACWCLELMTNVRHTLVTGSSSFGRTVVPACQHTYGSLPATDTNDLLF